MYIDDIIIYSETEAQHAAHVKQVFDLIAKARLSMKIEKCNFRVKEMNLTGFCFMAKGMEPFPDRCRSIQNFTVPKTRTGIQRFIGMVRY